MRKSRCNDSQRQAIMDSHLKGNETVGAIWGNGTKPVTLIDPIQASNTKPQFPLNP